MPPPPAVGDAMSEPGWAFVVGKLFDLARTAVWPAAILIVLTRQIRRKPHTVLALLVRKFERLAHLRAGSYEAQFLPDMNIRAHAPDSASPAETIDDL